MNIDRPRSTLYQLFEAVDIDASGQLDFNEFAEFMDRIEKPELEYMWSQLIGGQLDTIIGANGQLNIPEGLFDENQLPDNLKDYLTDHVFMQF